MSGKIITLKEEIALFVPFTAILTFLGLSPAFFPGYVSGYSIWLYLTAFLIAYPICTWIMNNFRKGHERSRKILYLYGLLIGGLIVREFPKYFSGWLSEFFYNPYFQTVIISTVTFGVSIGMIWNYERRFREHPVLFEQTRRTRYAILVSVVVVVYLFIIAVVIVNVFNYQLSPPFNIINPPPEGEYIPFSFTYPPSNETGTAGEVISLGQTIQLYVTAISNTTIVNNVPLIITAAASAPPSIIDTITTITLGFTGTLVWQNGAAILGIGSSNTAGIFLFQGLNYTGEDQQPISLNFGVNYEAPPEWVIFPGIGNYYPYITIGIVVTNSTGQNHTDFENYVYAQDPIYVSSDDVLATDRYNRINEVLTLALVGFGLIEGINIIEKLQKKVAHSNHPKLLPLIPARQESIPEKSKEQSKSKQTAGREKEPKDRSQKKT